MLYMAAIRNAFTCSPRPKTFPLPLKVFGLGFQSLFSLAPISSISSHTLSCMQHLKTSSIVLRGVLTSWTRSNDFSRGLSGLPWAEGTLRSAQPRSSTSPEVVLGEVVSYNAAR